MPPHPQQSCTTHGKQRQKGCTHLALHVLLEEELLGQGAAARLAAGGARVEGRQRAVGLGQVQPGCRGEGAEGQEQAVW